MQYAPHDTELADNFFLMLNDGGSMVKFQFPPKITNDSHKGSWQESELRGNEPTALYKGSGPRTFTITWTYLLDGRAWNSRNVARQVRLVRGYFASVREIENQTRNLVVFLGPIWHMGGSTQMTARLTSVDVKHSDTIVGTGFDAYPLRTDVSIDLRLWTQGDIQTVHQLERVVPTDWY